MEQHRKEDSFFVPDYFESVSSDAELAVKLTAIVLTWNSARYIETCLRSLFDNVPRKRIEMELFVVDGGSSDGTLEIISKLIEEIPSLKLIQLNRNLGTTVSRNMAINKSFGKYILLLDSDTKVLPGSIETLFQALESIPRAGIAAPRLLNPDGSVQHSCKRFPTAPLKVCKFVPISLLQRLGEKAELYPQEVYKLDFKEILRVDHCISACWLIRREALQQIGLFDERIFYAPEDADYCLRMWANGWEVLYVSSAEVVHHAQRLSHNNLQMALKHARGLVYYFRKHRYCLGRKRLYNMLIKLAEQRRIQLPPGISQSQQVKTKR